MAKNSSFGHNLSKAASIQTDVATSSPYSPVTADTVHPRNSFSKPALQACCHGYRVQAVTTNNILYLMHLLHCYKHSVSDPHHKSLKK